MKEYECAFYEWHGTGTSMQHLPGLAEMLNKHAAQGWELTDIKPVSIGFLVIFERPAAVAKEPVAPL